MKVSPRGHTKEREGNSEREVMNNRQPERETERNTRQPDLHPIYRHLRLAASDTVIGNEITDSGWQVHCHVKTRSRAQKRERRQDKPQYYYPQASNSRSLRNNHMSRCGLAVRRCAGKQKDLGSIRFGSLFSSNFVVYGHCLVTFPARLMKHSNVSHSCRP